MIRTLRLAGLLVGLAALACACSDTVESDACNRDSQCPIDYACRGGMCLLTCTDNAECPPGQSCLIGVCRPGVLDAGDEPDATPDVETEPDVPASPLGVGPDGQPIFGSPVGADCVENMDCRPGLTCAGDLCEPSGAGAVGDLCTVAGECGPGLGCSLEARCVASDGVGEGGACTPIAPAMCESGLRCEAFGLGGVCVPEGAGDIGAECVANGDCLAPLACSSEGACTIPVFGGLQRYAGRECSDEGDGDYRVYFEVPDGPDFAEFFRLPWPNDVRLSESGIDMSGFERLEPGVLGAEIINGVVDAVAADAGGFSPAPTIIFRFSEDYDFSTITILGDSPTLRYINIDDPESPSYGRGPSSINWFLNNGRGRFVCENALHVRGTWHQPLAHGETYAVYLTTGVTSQNGGATPVQDADFAAVLGPDRPPEAPLAAAWDAYAPFRDYLTRQDIDPSTIAAAAVFTTMDPDEDVPGLREAARGRAGTPHFDELELCDDGVTSPCDDGAARVCLNADAGYVELHGTYQAPLYQAGTRPYLTPADGGGLVIGDNGLPEEQGTDVICLSMTLPVDGGMPEDGWPVVLFAHGTGGDFLSHLRNGTAASLTSIDAGAETIRFATIGIDGVLHGPRRGASTLDPEVLFFNVENPAAAVGNVLQGAADYFYLTYLVEELDLDAPSSPTGEAIRFDADNIFFFGHSQGSTVGTPFVAYEPLIRGAVFSGAGSGLILSLLNKQEPVPVASLVQYVLNDGDIRDSHPVLALVQQAADRADALHYGSLLIDAVPEGGRPHSLFVTYGLGDSYTPDPTIEVFGSRSGAQLAQPSLRAVGAIPSVNLPATGNRTTPGGDVTAVVVTYQPAEGRDGHFVAFDDASAMTQIREFLATGVRDGVPTVSAVE